MDVGVVRTPFKSEGLRCRFAAAEPLVAVMPTDLEVGSDLSCALEDLAAVPLALARRQVPAVSSAFAEKGLSPQVACVMDDVRACVLWAREGMASACRTPATSASRAWTAAGWTRARRWCGGPTGSSRRWPSVPWPFSASSPSPPNLRPG